MLSLAEIAKEVHLRIDQEEDTGIPPLTRSGTFEIVKGVFDVISQAAAIGEGTSIPKFGKFHLKINAARVGRNPKTGESLDIPEKLVIKFTPSSTLRAAFSEANISEIKEAMAEKAVKKPKKKAKGKKKK